MHDITTGLEGIRLHFFYVCQFMGQERSATGTSENIKRHHHCAKETRKGAVKHGGAKCGNHCSGG